jgi:hypothetical protein
MVPVAVQLVNMRGGLTVESSPGVMFLDVYALQPTSKAHCDYFYKESNVKKIECWCPPDENA